MQNCSKCYWCQVSFAGKRKWKCKYNPKKRFNYKELHGQLCKNFTFDSEYSQRESTQLINPFRLGLAIGCGIGMGIANGLLLQSVSTGVIASAVGFMSALVTHTILEFIYNLVTGGFK